MEKSINEFMDSLREKTFENETANIIINGIMKGEHRFAHFASYFTNPFKRLVSGMQTPLEGNFDFEALGNIKIEPKLLEIIDRKKLWRTEGEIPSSYAPIKIDWSPIRLSIKEAKQILKINQSDYRITLAELCTIIKEYNFSGIPNAHSIIAFIITTEGNDVPVIAGFDGKGSIEISIINEKESEKGDNEMNSVVWMSGY
jgi:hypothetical protein